MPRINFINQQEIRQFETPNHFNYKEQVYFFTLPKKLQDITLSFEDDENILIFTLLFGYFKSVHKFFELKSFYQKDINHIKDEYHLKCDSTILSAKEKTLHRYKIIIKDYLAINNYSLEIQNTLQQEANNLANNFIHRKKMFYVLINLSKKLKIEIPSHTELTRIITVALNTQKRDILEKLEPLLQDERLNVLDKFLQKDEDSKNRYQLSSYRRLEHTTTKNKLLLSLKKFNIIKAKFHMTKEILKCVGITPKIATYYARWVEKGKTTQLTQTNVLNQKFTLLSFVYYQYLIRNDNLIDRFIAVIQTAKNSSFRAQKEFSYELEPQKNRMIHSLEDANISTLNDIEQVLQERLLSAENKVIKIEELVARKMQILKDILAEKKVFETLIDNKYNFIEKKSVSLQGKLSGIVKVIAFDGSTSNKNIIAAIEHFKNNPNITSKAPSEFLNDEEKTAVYESGKFRVSLYKVLLFFHVGDAIKNGTLNLKYSLKYRNFEDYMIDKGAWTNNRETLLNVHELEHLNVFKTFLEPIKTKLENSFKQSNKNIANGFNTYFTSNQRSFLLKTPKLEKHEEDVTIAKYFPMSEYISVIDLLHAIDEEVNFLSPFQHYNQSKSKVDKKLLLAALLGYGCNLSLPKIGKISKGINENQLDNIKSWYLSEENTSNANEKIIKYMDNLEIIKSMRSDREINHTSSDGQKYNISHSIDSTNAGYSFKYFGTDKGVVAYTFIDESHRLFHSQVINVNERESGYVIDGLLHNNTVKSDIHSTDTHGFTEIVFGLTHLLGFAFAPRIKNFKDQQLYGFNNLKSYHQQGYALIPKRKVNEKLISDNWDDILRFVITIKERKTTATQLLKRLTSYSRQHKLYSALKEFGKIIKTDFLLNYIDDVELRQRIEKQLNKVEASNKFSKAVFFGNNSEFTVATVEEQNIANNSKRLIQNAIILWNYMYITKKLQQAPNQKERDEILNALKNSSIVHWSHINFYGEYDFTRSSKRIHRLITLDESKGFLGTIGLGK